MADKKLARNVTIGAKTYGPKDDVPAEVLEQIRNPKAFVPLGDAPKTEDHSGREGGTASGAKLAGPVTVGARTYGPNDFIPDDVARQIRNPKAWKDGKVPSVAAKEAKGPAGGSSPDRSAGGDTTPDQPPAGGEGEGDNPPAPPSDEGGTGGSDQKTARKSTSSTKRS